jgi:hypothetical protein
VPTYVVIGVANVETPDQLSAWHRAHTEPQALRWEIAVVAPEDHPEHAVEFASTLGGRIERARARRSLAAAAAFTAALLFPSYLVLQKLFPGI